MPEGNQRLRPLNKLPLFEQVAATLTEYIAANEIQPGQKLMSERDLAAQLRVSRSSVREAVATLRSQGIVESRHGEGIFLRRLPGGPDSIVTLQIEIPEIDLPYIWESRQALESQCARLAASRSTGDDLATLEHALDLMAFEIERGLPGIKGDRMFHQTVAAASHNPMLIQFLTAMQDALDRTSSKSLHAPGQPARSLADHREIFEAIRDHEPADAGNAMLSHLVRTTDLLLGTPHPNS